MEIIKVYNQGDLDRVPDDFKGIIQICGGNRLNRIIVNRKWENSSVEAWENSSVEARGNSSVEAWENSSVVAWENSSVVARENSSVVARENSSVVARENSSVEAWGNSSVVARENSSVVARENSSVEAWGNNSVVARENSSVVARENSSVDLFGYSQARICSDRIKYKTNGNSRIILPFEDIDDYINYFDIKDNGNTITLYKAVHKIGETAFVSDWMKGFGYNIGETVTQKNTDKNVYNDCGVGLHVSTLHWSLMFGRNFDDLAIIECEVPKDKTVVYKFTDGKIRTSELKVIREVPLEECGAFGKMLAKKKGK